MKVAVFSTRSYDRESLNQYNTNFDHELVYFETQLSKDTASLAKGFGAVCVFVNDRLDKETLDLLAENGVGLIALRCAGFNNVDIDHAKAKKIKVCRVPAYSPHAIAEHATALILTLNRKTHKAYNRIRENNFSLEKLTGFDLYKKTVGVIGTGQIGAVFCTIMLGFGCRVIASDVIQSNELRERGVEYKSLPELFAESDIISLHCPLTPETKHLINSKTFAQMKTGMMLINTSRGAVVNTQDTIDALKSGKLGYLGIDVYEQEEKIFFKDLSETILADDLIARLVSFPNVLITSHQGFLTNEAFEQIATTTLQNIKDYENKSPLVNEVNGEG